MKGEVVGCYCGPWEEKRENDIRGCQGDEDAVGLFDQLRGGHSALEEDKVVFIRS